MDPLAPQHERVEMTRKKKGPSDASAAAAEGGEASGAAAMLQQAAEPKAKTPEAKPKAVTTAEGAKCKAKAAEPKAVVAKAAEPAKAAAVGKAPAAAGKAPAAAAAAAALGAEPKARGDPKAKAAEPKAKTPEAKAKAPTARSQTLAAVAQPPAPALAAEAAAPSLEGMEAVQRKKRRNRKKEEAPAPEPEVQQSGPTEEDLADTARMREAHDSRNNELLGKIQQRLEDIPDLSSRPKDEVVKDVAEQRKVLESIMLDCENTMKTVKITRPKNLNVGKLMEQMCELRLCKDDGTFTEATKKEMLKDVEQALSSALAFESFRAFQVEISALKTRCEQRIEQNEAVAKTVRSGNFQRRILARVAQAKGVKVEELNADDVQSVDVQLPAEVIQLFFLFQRKFEKEHGVIVERADGPSKGGGGKGSSGAGSGAGGGASSSKLTVRGLNAEVAACIAALKAVDVSERKIINVNAKQAAAIMGPSQSNARKLEQDHKGVFVHSDRNQITLYGPTKEVAACAKSIGTIMAEEPVHPSTTGKGGGGPSPMMTVDKDQARALIGAAGRNVQRIEAETGTSIKINIPPNKEDESPATVKIVGEAASQDKAREQIKAFLAGLAVCLVEAEAEVVSRLYDGAIRKGKGKGRTKGHVEGSSKFGELREISGLTVVRKTKPSGVLLVGDKEDVAKWKGVLQECLRDAGTMPEAVPVLHEQAYLWTTERLDAVKESSGAKEVRLARRPREAAVEVVGTDEQKEKARAAVQEIHDKFGSVETIEDVPINGVRSLLSKGAGRTRELEQKYEVSIVVDRKVQAVRILGAKESVEDARKAVEQVISAAESGVAGGGSGPGAGRGSSGATCAATGDGSGAADTEAAPGGSGGGGRGSAEDAPNDGEAEDGAMGAAAGGVPSPIGSWADRSKKGQGKSKPNLESKESFPTLGGGDGPRSGGRGARPKQTAWKTVEDTAAADDGDATAPADNGTANDEEEVPAAAAEAEEEEEEEGEASGGGAPTEKAAEEKGEPAPDAESAATAAGAEKEGEEDTKKMDES